jgi:hypothetical protein
MPCRCDDFQGSYGGSYGGGEDFKKARKRLDRVTQLLCYLCGELREDGIFEKYAANCEPLERWAKKHHAADEDRVYKKMLNSLRSEAVAKNGYSGMPPQALAAKFIQQAESVHPVSRWHRSWFLKMAKKACAERDRIVAKRKSKKDLAEKALAKLSIEERKALGITRDRNGSR